MGMIYLPTSLDFEGDALARAKDDYVSDKIGLTEFEAAVARILDGTDRWYTSPFEPFATERP